MGDSDVQPFAAYAGEYLDQGWHPLPLPVKKKRFPPTGFTGRAGAFADDKQLQKWLKDMTFEVKRDDGTTYDCAIGNIAIRVGNKILGNDGKLYEVIGIDVDDYGEKHGWDELKRLEETYGTLPDTWTSSARDDRRSGIRFFLVPQGLAFKGKPDESVTAIEIVQRVHRYAVVWPSYNPNAKAEYRWYAPGDLPDGANYTRRVPHVNELALLPEPWVEHLTAGYTRDAEGKYGIDLDVTREELMVWVKSKFNGTLEGSPDGMCDRMRNIASHHVSAILDSDSSHDVLTAAHWNILHECMEGHSGYKEAIQAIETVWLEEVGRQNKRTVSEIKGEFKRSLHGTLRKMKAAEDAAVAQGYTLFLPEVCESLSDLTGDADPEDVDSDDDPWAEDTVDRWIDRIQIRTKGIEIAKYGKSEIEQAEHFLDRIGEQNIRFVWDYNEWIIFDRGRWVMDKHHQIKRLFWKAVCEPLRRKAIECFRKADSMVEAGRSASDPEVTKLKKQAAEYDRVAEMYGNNAKIESTLKLVQSFSGIGIRYGQLNWDPTILAMPGGQVIRLERYDNRNPKRDSEGYKVIDNLKDFYTTKSLAVDLLMVEDVPAEEKQEFQDYLDLFLPDRSYQKFVRRVLGSTIFGGNPNKLAIFLIGGQHTGKSTMIHCLEQALGDYYSTFSPTTIFREQRDGGSPEIVELAQRRVIGASEVGSIHMNASKFKNATGGDNIIARRLYANSMVDVTPQYTAVIAANSAPIIEAADPATIDRILVLPFDKTVTPETNDPSAAGAMPPRVKHAVLLWLLTGYRDYVRMGLGRETWHDASLMQTAKFATELNDLGVFLEEQCEIATPDEIAKLVRLDRKHGPWCSVDINLLYRAYEIHFKGEKNFLSSIRFRRKVCNLLGIDTVRVRQGDLRGATAYRGLKWRSDKHAVRLDHYSAGVEEDGTGT